MKDAFTFGLIIDAVKLRKSFLGAVTALQHDEFTASTFADLRESTVRSWYEPHTFTLKASVAEKWKRGGTHECSGRPSMLDSHSDLEQWVVKRVENLRRAGGVINSHIVLALFRGLLKVKAPHLIKEYRISRRWCRNWMQTQLAYSFRKSTSGGQKLPLDWEDQVRDMATRVSGTAARYNITHGCFIINFDQTGLHLMQTYNYTYHSQGEKQVPIAGSEDKRQITAVVGSTLDGGLLPLQLIFQGQEHNKKQHRAVPVLPEITQKRVSNARFHLTQSPSHWSTLESMKDYIRVVVTTWVRRKAAELDVTDPHCVIVLDCWKVHTSAAFREWMKSNYPRYHLVFVPAGCTGKAQPADVMLQRPFKGQVMYSFTAWMSNQISVLVNTGSDPDTLKVDTSLSTLKPLLVDWAWFSWFCLLQKPELIKEGWVRCGMGNVMEAAQQRDAMRYCLNTAEPELGEEEHHEENNEGDDDEEDVDGEEDEGVEEVVVS
jgi:hypothetical protein